MEISETMHKKIDLIYVSQIEPASRVETEVMETGIRIYGRKEVVYEWKGQAGY